MDTTSLKWFLTSAVKFAIAFALGKFGWKWLEQVDPSEVAAWLSTGIVAVIYIFHSLKRNTTLLNQEPPK